MPLKAFSFPSTHRLRSQQSFDLCIKQGLRLSSRLFVFFCRPNQTEHARLGVLLGKKKCRLAVDRNHLRRQIRERFRLNQHQFTGVDVVVLLKSPIKTLEDPAITECLDKQFAKLIASRNG